MSGGVSGRTSGGYLLALSVWNVYFVQFWHVIFQCGSEKGRKQKKEISEVGSQTICMRTLLFFYGARDPISNPRVVNNVSTEVW